MHDRAISSFFIFFMTSLLKNILRDTYRGIRNGLSDEYQVSISLKICNNIQKLEQYRYAKRISLYHAFGKEVNLDTLWRSAPRQGKFCYFPAVNEDNTLSFLPATPSTSFKPNRFGILEPNVSKNDAIATSELQAILIPLVVFDKECTRIGMGGGFYDRTLGVAEKLPFLIGVAYEFQRHTYIKPQAWDIPLNAVVTEKAIYWRV